MLRIGIAGIGFMGMIHFLSYRKVPGARVRALCEKEEKRLAGDWRGIKGNFGPAGTMMDLSGIATYRELEWMVQGGMSTASALSAATLSAAKLCDVATDLGSIAPGKLADFVAMPRNPLDDIRALRELDVVVKDGTLVRDGCH